MTFQLYNTKNLRRDCSTDLKSQPGLQLVACLLVELTWYSSEHQTEDVLGLRLDDTPVRSGDLDHLLKPSQGAESLPSQLPPQNTEADMARQDSGNGSPGADRNPQHPRHAEASATAMECPTGEK
ncbi:unnamed protein product [Schistocephalus solidus]|uniref:GAGE domain-containing protein n=1 Tax=Schistocephalus solidus TaxID=70667 RepID=A0A183TK29_SCHSO|nr:unnamed protein product [Schistocephalus solidus]